MKQWLGLAPVAAALVAFAPATQAEIIAPVGLNPGDTYHLIFVTSTTRDATSSNIADYNSFVQGVADAEGIGVSEGVSWYAVASTDTVNANVNAVVSADVYRIDGTLVAASADFYTNIHLAPINLEEDGVTSSAGRVWSASYANGTLNTLGGHTGLGGTAGKSISGDTSAGAIANGGKWLQQHWGTTHGTAQSFYALSEELTVVSAGDTDAPTPNPATFLSAPAADSDTAISMTATTGTDASGPVEYFFDETSGNPGGTDSGWQTSPSYTDTGLAPNTLYTYTVQMRDSVPNTGTASAPSNATTLNDTFPPTPNPAAFASAPVEISDSAISMTAVTGSDPSGPVEYYFAETSGNLGGTDSGWQTSPNYTDTGLAASTMYTYTVKMRDSLLIEGTASGGASATTWGPPTEEIIVPAGLNPGDTYHLIFVTSTTRDATSSNIADYNTFAQGVADAEGIGSTAGVSWYAVASTDTDNAIDNATVSAPVYLMDGTTLVADDSAEFYSATHQAAINLQEDGTAAPSNRLVWSGSLDTGTLNTLGNPPHGGLGGSAGKSTSGRTSLSGSGWLQGEWNKTHGTAQSFYALSEELTVPGTSTGPEIISITSLGSGNFELTLKGENDTSYEFYSSTTLDFASGTLVPLTVIVGTGGPTDVTTTSTGDATVQMSLGADPANFVRAVGQ